MIITRPLTESFGGRESAVGADLRIRPQGANATGKQHFDHECRLRMAKCGRAFVPCSYSIGLIAGGYADPPLRLSGVYSVCPPPLGRANGGACGRAQGLHAMRRKRKGVTGKRGVRESERALRMILERPFMCAEPPDDGGFRVISLPRCRWFRAVRQSYGRPSCPSLLRSVH